MHIYLIFNSYSIFALTLSSKEEEAKHFVSWFHICLLWKNLESHLCIFKCHLNKVLDRFNNICKITKLLKLGFWNSFYFIFDGFDNWLASSHVYCWINLSVLFQFCFLFSSVNTKQNNFLITWKFSVQKTPYLDW